MVSLEAEGLWLRLCFLMHRSPRPGYLLKPNGEPLTSAREIARAIGRTADEVRPALKLLENEGVFDRDLTENPQGIIYSRRMVKRAEASARNSRNIRNRWEKNSEDSEESLSRTPSRITKGDTTSGNGNGYGYDPYSLSLSDPDPDPEKSTGHATSPPQFELSVSTAPPTRPLEPELVRDIWNAMAATIGLPVVERLTDRRRLAVRMRLREPGRDEAWVRRYVARIAATPFCCGENDRGWKADFDFAFRSEDVVTRVFEGSYSGTRPKRQESTTARLMRRAVEQRQVELAEEAVARNGSNGAHGPPSWEFDDPPLLIEGGV